MTNLFFKSAFLAAAMSAIAVSCAKDSNPAKEPSTPSPEVKTDTVIYAIGQEIVPDTTHYYAIVWKDGKRHKLTDGKHDGFCNGIYADGGDIYVVGCEGIGDLFDDGYYDPYNLNVGILWKFKAGEEDKADKTILSDGKYATSPLAVTKAGNDIYIAGFDTPVYDRRAILWKNDKPTYLTDGTTDALAYCITSSGEDVYVGGYIQPAENKKGGKAVIWKNGVPQYLTDGTSTIAKVTAIAIDNGKVYAAGTERNSEGRWRGVLWTDGQATYFTDYEGTEVSAIHVKDGHWTISGNKTNADGNIVVCVWSDGKETVIEGKGYLDCQGIGLAVVGDDIYVGGNETTFDSYYNAINHAYLWKNGEEQTLEADNHDDMSIWGITAAYVPIE